MLRHADTLREKNFTNEGLKEHKTELELLTEYITDSLIHAEAQN